MKVLASILVTCSLLVLVESFYQGQGYSPPSARSGTGAQAMPMRGQRQSGYPNMMQNSVMRMGMLENMDGYAGLTAASRMTGMRTEELMREIMRCRAMRNMIEM